MKKFTLLSVLLLLFTLGSHAQCFRTSMYPYSTVVSNNLGLPQVVTTGVYTSEYSQLSNISVGTDYIFTCQLGTTDNYITVTDWSNNVIAFGPSPLTVEAITSDQIRLHYSDDAACASTSQSHTVTVTAILSCSPPINLTVSGITTTDATFAWEPQGSETAWQVLVLPNGTTAPTAGTSGTDVTANPTYTYTGLTSAGNFQFYVRSNCGSEFSPWNGPLDFASGCDPITSINENFDAFAYGALPICWAQVKNGTGSSQYSIARVTDYNYNSPSRAIQLYSENTGTEANLIVATPNLGNLSAGTNRLKFFAKSGNATGSIQFGTIDNTTASGVFTLLATLEVTNTYQEYSIDYTGYEGTDTFIAIRHNGTQYSSVYLDDIRWEVAPVCADVSDILIPAATITDATATVTWTANGDETAWDVVYGPATVTDPSTLTPISPAPTTNPEVTLTGLTDNTNYKVWVRSACSANDGVWVGPKTFKTTCLPTATMSENFDTVAYGALPDCWSAVKNGTGVSQYAYAQVTDYNYYSPSRAGQLYNSDSGAAANIMLVSPQLSNIATGAYRVKFYAKSGSTTGSLQVGTISSNNADGVFTSLATIPLTSTYTEYVVEFNDTENADSYIAFRHNTTGTYNSIFIDNVLWELTPTCADVTQIAASETTINSATISWNPGGDETQWDLVYGATTVTDPNTLTPISPAPTVNPETSLTGLTDNTFYKVWVRSVCGAENGAWIGPITFKTQCIATTLLDENFDAIAYGALPDCWTSVKNGTGVSTYAYAQVVDYSYYSASRAAQLYNSESGAAANIMLVSPPLSNIATGVYRVKFYAKSGGDTGSLQVGTIDSNDASGNFTSLATIALTSTYTEYAINFTDTNTTDAYIAFRHNTSGMYNGIFIDNIRWELAPLCADVANITAAGITTSTATVNWESQGSETNWEVVYGPTSVTDPTTLTPSALLTETNYAISGLADNTTYKVWVRSVCGDPNGNGAWIGPMQFTTLCLPTTVPFTEDFESVTTPNLPACSIMENVGTGNNWRTVDYPGYGFTNKTLNYRWNLTNAADVWYFTKGIMLTAGTEYSISYRYGNSSTTNYKENLGVMYGMGANAESMTEEIADHLDIQTPTPITNEVFFTPTVTGVYYFGFHAHSLANQDQLYVDDITIDAALANKTFAMNDLRSYPNPVKDVLNVSYKQNISNVAVFNLLGQKVIENTINANSAKIDMSSLSRGTYLVKVTSDNQIKTIKVIKE